MSTTENNQKLMFKFEGGTGGIESDANLGTRTKSKLNVSHESSQIRDTMPSEKPLFKKK